MLLLITMPRSCNLIDMIKWGTRYIKQWTYGVCYPGEGGARIIYGVWVSEVWNPYPYLRIFLPQKWLIWLFFLERYPFLRVFYLQNGWFFNFYEMGPCSKDFLTKIGLVSKNFWWKSNPFGWLISVCLNM